jgi:hypothetical protein
VTAHNVRVRSIAAMVRRVIEPRRVVLASVQLPRFRGTRHIWATFSIVLVAAATVIAYVVRRTERESRRRLHLQAWHLR